MPKIEVLFSPTFEQDIDELENDYPGALDEVEKLVASLNEAKNQVTAFRASASQPIKCVCRIERPIAVKAAVSA
jgi:hypothetical protein